MDQVALAQNVHMCYLDSPYMGVDKILQAPVYSPDIGLMMDYTHKGFSVLGAATGIFHPPVGLMFMVLGQGCKMIRNLSAYDMSLIKAPFSNTYSGLIGVALKTIALAKPEIGAFAALIGIFDVLEEGELLVSREQNHLSALENSLYPFNATGVQYATSQLRFIRVESQTAACNLFFKVIGENHPELINTLGKNKNLSPNLQDDRGNTLAHHAVLQNNPKLIMALAGIEGADFNIVNQAGDSPLAVAANLKLSGVAEALLAAGANPNFYLREGYYLAEQCYFNNALPFFKVLAQNENFNPMIARDGGSLLARAVRENNSQWLDCFIQLHEMGSPYQKGQIKAAYHALNENADFKIMPGFDYFNNQYLKEL